MPQVVEVLKYVHEVCETESLGCAVNVNVQAQEARYRELYSGAKTQIDILLVELRKLFLSTSQANFCCIGISL